MNKTRTIIAACFGFCLAFCAGAAAVPISFALPKASFVTIVIDDANGHRVRNLIAEREYAAGPHSIDWDGVDDTGKPVAPGEYAWRGLYRDPLKLEYQFSVYDANAQPPWFTAQPYVPSDSGWLSDHNPARAVAAIGDKVFVGTITGENGHDIMALDARTGRKLWGKAGTCNGADAAVLCADDQYVYGGGEAQWSGNNAYVFRVDPQTYRIDTLWHYPKRIGLRGIAARDGKVYVSSDNESKIFVLDAAPGDPGRKALREIPLSEPGGIAFTPTGKLLAISGRDVVAVNDDGGTTPLIRDHLAHPNRLAIANDGTIYVSDGPSNWNLDDDLENNTLYGKPAGRTTGDNQIKVFSSGGDFLRAIGKPGGRKPGPYDPGAMRCPIGLALDNQNRLWVTEWDMLPKRISVWDPQTGKLDEEFLGAHKYGGGGALDPGDRTVMIYDGMLFKLDWGKGTWKLTDTIVDIMNANVEAAHTYGGYGEGPTRIIRYKGEQYFVGGADWVGVAENGGIVWKRKGDTFQAVAYVGRFNPGSDNAGLYLNTAHYLYPRMVEQVGDKSPGFGREAGYPPDKWHSHLSYTMLWADQNGDGIVQPDEVTFTEKPHWWLAETLIGPDLSVYFRKASHLSKFDLWRLPLSHFNAQGAPVYDMAKLETLTTDDADRAGGSLNGMATDSAGRLYTISNPIHGYDPVSKTTWTYPNSWPGLSPNAPRAAPGLIVDGFGVRGACNMGGTLGGLVAFNSNFGQWYLFTGDGLFVSTLFGDTRTSPYWGTQFKEAKRGMDVQGASLGQESFQGWFGRTSDGQVYIVAGHPHCSIVKVAGLDSVVRLAGSNLRLDAMAANGAVSSGQTTPQELAVHAFQWNYTINEPFIIKSGDAQVARVWLAYDADNLTARFDVRDTSPLQNAGVDPHLLFKTGDSVDLQIGLDPNADPGRTSPTTGDIRLLLTKTKDGAVGVLYRYKIAGGATPQRFWSPTGEVLVDKIEVLRAPQDLKIETAADKEGYTLSATIPWRVLADADYAAPVGAKLRGDVGVLFSDPGGSTTVERVYAFNKDTGVVADVPSEIRLHPEKWGLLHFVN